ncbi:MAG: amidohydrolase, partial [Nitrosopumilaceae archaeon]|nr:amidohydrolase [Nitrosopumilaceae archaeon]
PDQVGNIYCGRSIVVDPYGKILLDMKKRQGIGIVNISLDDLKRTRTALPLLQNRRTDLYNNFKI